MADQRQVFGAVLFSALSTPNVDLVDISLWADGKTSRIPRSPAVIRSSSLCRKPARRLLVQPPRTGYRRSRIREHATALCGYQPLTDAPVSQTFLGYRRGMQHRKKAAQEAA